MVKEWHIIVLELSTHKNNYGYPWVTVVPCVGKALEKIIGPLS